MGTIESKLSYLLRIKEEIRNAINGKGVKVTEQDTFRSYADKNRSIVGTEYYIPSLATDAVNFKDYDGGVLHTYTKDEFLALTEMPALPQRPRLVCQGWNYTLEDAKAHVQEYGRLDIGATYITDDGKTRLYIKVEGERKSFPIKFSIDKASSLTIDWGDGETESISGSGSLNASHTYDAVGDYVICFDVAEGATLSFGTSSASSSSSYYTIATPYNVMLRKVEFGNRVQLLNSVFINCRTLSSLVIPQGVTSIGTYAFYECNSLSSVVIPQGVTSIGTYAFYECYSLSSVVIPQGVTSIKDGAFYYCYSLSSVVLPQGFLGIGSNAFYYCYSLSSVVIPNSVISIGAYAFGACYSLSSVVLPQGITSTGSNVFYNCYSLASVVIPQGITSIKDGAFYNCYSLSSVMIPNSVTSIGNVAFSGCDGIAFFDFRTNTSVPSLSSNAFGIPSDCKIVVPDELYDKWIAATNWSSYASYIVKASEFNG